jgi:hypothetical protein
MSELLYNLTAAFYFGWMALRHKQDLIGWVAMMVVALCLVAAFIDFLQLWRKM